MILLRTLSAVIAWPIVTKQSPLIIASRNNSDSHPFIIPLSMLLVWGPVLPAEATLPFLPTTTQRHSYTVFQQRPVDKTVRQVQELEDDRLSQCREKGPKWEQCFFYGTDTVATNHRGEFLRARPSPSKGGPPSW